MSLLHSGFTALALVWAFALPVSAQQATYCGGVLKANAAYSNVLSNGSTAQVEYHLQLQNQDPQRRSLTVTMLPMPRIGQYQVLRPASLVELGPYQQKDIAILTLQIPNPSGTGAPSPATVANTVRYNCAFR